MTERNLPYFYDQVNETVLLGEEALVAHFEAGGHPADVIPVVVALLDKSIKITKTEVKAKKNGLDKDAAIRDGQFLVSLVHSYDESKNSNKQSNEKSLGYGNNRL